MKAIIKLGSIKTPTIQDPNRTMPIPFWFTLDKSIHLGGDVIGAEIEVDLQPEQILKEIIAGFSKGLIVSDNEEAFYKALEALTNTEQVRAPKQEIKAPAAQDRLDEIKQNRYKAEAEEIIKKTLADISKTVGTVNDNEDDLLSLQSSGIDDVSLLQAIIDAESAKPKPRKQVLALVEKRINAIKKASQKA